MLCASAGWQLFLLGRETVRFFDSATIWPVAEARLPVYLLSGVGGAAFLLGRPGGLRFVIAAAGYSSAASAILDPLLWPGILPWFDSSQFLIWTSSATVVLLAVVAARMTTFQAGASPTANWLQFSLRSLILGVFAVALLCGCRVSWQRLENQANDMQTKALFEKTLTTDEQIASSYPHTPAGRVALSYVGRKLFEAGRYDDASRQFSSLLALPRVKHSFDYFDLYLVGSAYHRAELYQSQCFEQLGDVQTALVFAVMARDTYPPCDACGVAAVSEWSENNDRIAQLESRLDHDGSKAAR